MYGVDFFSSSSSSFFLFFAFRICQAFGAAIGNFSFVKRSFIWKEERGRGKGKFSYRDDLFQFLL